MAISDFTNQNIQDTYKRVVQTDGTKLADGSGSLLPITFDGNDVIIPGALRAHSYIVSQSTTVFSSGSTIFGDSHDDTHTFSGSVSINDRTNTNYNAINTSLSVRQDGVNRQSIANGFGGSIDFLTSRGESADGTTVPFNGARSGRIASRLTHGAQTVNDFYALDFEVRSNDTQIGLMTLHTSNANTAGRVGILDTTPSYVLDVNGTGRFVGALYANNLLSVGDTLTVGANATFNGTNNTMYGNLILPSQDEGAVTPHISASGNYSSSLAATVQAGSGSFHVLRGDTSKSTGLNVEGFINATSITSSIITTGDISASGDLEVRHITSSNISSTGNITATQTVQAEHLHSTDDASITNILSVGDKIVDKNNTDTAIHWVSNYMTHIDVNGTTLIKIANPLSSTDYVELKADSIISGSATIHGNITASGDISASGNILATRTITSNISAPGSLSDRIELLDDFINIHGGDSGADSKLFFTIDDLTDKLFINKNSVDIDFQVNTDTSRAIFVDGGNDRFFIGNSHNNYQPFPILYSNAVENRFTSTVNIANYGFDSSNNGFQHTGLNETFPEYNLMSGSLLRVIGHTPSGYSPISASLHMSSSFGNIQLNDGHITASGDISASATIIGNIISGSIISGSFVGDGSGLTNIPSSFTAAGITGSFTEASASFSTRVTANDAKLTANTTNVTNAGALMDSEVDDDIKTLALPANTTISAFGASLIDDAAASNARTTLGLGTAATTAASDYATLAGTQTFTGDKTFSGALTASSGLTVTGNVSASGNVTGITGSFGRLEATSNTALQLQNNQKIQFENAVGKEFGNIFMNTSDQMIFQNARSNKNIFIRAGNAGNEGNVIIQKGGTETTIAKFGVAEGQFLEGSLTASGNISASGHISASDGGAGYVVRPNLYFFATNTSEIILNNDSNFGGGTTDNQGSLPATNTTTVTLTEEQNSHTSVFSLSGNRVTISRAGLYKMTYNVLLEIKHASNRSEGFVGIVQEASGVTTLVDGSEARGYHRFLDTARPSGDSYAASVIVNVAAGSIYDVRFGITKQSLANQKLGTIPTGTSFMIEAIT